MIEGAPMVSYSGGDEFDGATFERRCPKCGAFVEAGMATFDGRGQPIGTNAACRRCGPVAMPFVGYP